MREQVVASRGSHNRSGREFVQRPARRVVRTVSDKQRSSVRVLTVYVPIALRIVAVVLLAATFIVAYRAAASASLFQLRAVDIAGTSRTSTEEIESLVRRAVSRTGVWRADMSAISSELARLPSVRRAVVTRVLPDRLRIRLTERVPVAVVRTSAGHFIWVDDEGVSLGEMKSTDQMPLFFIRGWNEDGFEDVISSNAERVQKYMELAREWQLAGLADRVSEVNLIDIRDIRVQLAGDDSQIEIRLGGEDATQRLKSALDALDRYKQAPNGSTITYVDSQGPRVTLGFSSGNKLKANPDSALPARDTTVASRATPGITGNTSSSPRAADKKTSDRARQQVSSAKENREAKNDRRRAPRH